ncbi:hypothetical protein SAMN05444392_106104 [Seinonella peptonophila]|uniref:Uncharacterized protein n=1 Tax=Seinonella peptonophila TaxID=112248 RepID=A0A1M4Y8T1_9BACL|nr:hypothetical protein [Seinonella peptonophila]SHF02013.1 hypothetical protein SAMN05444392_106104 [Seinonella peptonophila]
MAKFQDQTITFKISWMFLLITGVGILGFGILVSLFPQIAGDYDRGFLRALGVATTGMGFFGIMITFKSYIKKEKWAWFTLWYYPIFWILHLIGGLPPGNDHIHQVVFIVISLLGLVFPYKQFFSRKIIKL